MDEQEAGELYEYAYDAWESDDQETFIDSAGALNAWLMEGGEGPLMPEDWYPDDLDAQEAMWDWIDSLSHEDREAFFGY